MSTNKQLYPPTCSACDQKPDDHKRDYDQKRDQSVEPIRETKNAAILLRQPQQHQRSVPGNFGVGVLFLELEMPSRGDATLPEAIGLRLDEIHSRLFSTNTVNLESSRPQLVIELGASLQHEESAIQPRKCVMTGDWKQNWKSANKQHPRARMACMVREAGWGADREPVPARCRRRHRFHSAKPIGACGEPDSG